MESGLCNPESAKCSNWSGRLTGCTAPCCTPLTHKALPADCIVHIELVVLTESLVALKVNHRTLIVEVRTQQGSPDHLWTCHFALMYFNDVWSMHVKASMSNLHTQPRFARLIVLTIPQAPDYSGIASRP